MFRDPKQPVVFSGRPIVWERPDPAGGPTPLRTLIHGTLEFEDISQKVRGHGGILAYGEEGINVANPRPRRIHHIDPTFAVQDMDFLWLPPPGVAVTDALVSDPMSYGSERYEAQKSFTDEIAGVATSRTVPVLFRPVPDGVSG